MLNMFVGIVCEGFTLESEDVGDETLGNEIYQAYLVRDTHPLYWCLMSFHHLYRAY